MIDFACKTFSLKEVIKCSLGLTKADNRVFEYFLNHPEKWLNTHEISKALKFNLSTVQKSVKKLNEKGVVKRSQENLEGGGYLYHYQVNSKREIAKVILEIVNNWTKTVEKSLKAW